MESHRGRKQPRTLQGEGTQRAGRVPGVLGGSASTGSRGGGLEGAEGGRGALPRPGWGRGADLRIEDHPLQMRG